MSRITDRNIQVGGITSENNLYQGAMAGVVVDPNGGCRMVQQYLFESSMALMIS